MLEFDSHLIRVALFIGLFALVGFFQKDKAAVNKETGEKVVEHGIILKIISITLVIGCILGIGYFYIYHLPENLMDWIIYVCISIIGLVITSVVIIEAYNSKVYFNDEGIRKVSVWTKNHFIKWGEIKNFKHSRILNMYIMEGNNGAKIRVEENMNGCDNFLLELKRRHPDYNFGYLQDTFINILEAEDVHENYQEGLYFSPNDELHLGANFNLRKLHENQLQFLDGLEYVLTELNPENLDFSKVLYKETKGKSFNELNIIIPHNKIADFYITLKVFPDNIVVGLCGLDESFNNYNENPQSPDSKPIEVNDENQPPEFVIDCVNYIGFLLESVFLLRFHYKGEKVSKIDLIHIGNEGNEELGQLKPIALPSLNLFKEKRTVDEIVSFSKTE